MLQRLKLARSQHWHQLNCVIKIIYTFSTATLQTGHLQSRRGYSAHFLSRNSLNEFFLMSAFFLFSPPCLPTDILSFNSSVAWQEWRERGREWEGEGMDGERKKVCFSIKRLSLETVGNTLTLPWAFWWCLLCFVNSMIHNSSSGVLSPLLPLLFSPSFPLINTRSITPSLACLR